MDIPVYLVTGFLESGKTSFIKEMLNDEAFNDGEMSNLIITCEEGEEEFTAAELSDMNAVVVNIEDKDSLTEDFFAYLEDYYCPDRVFIEYNAVWTLEAMAQVKKPENWILAQRICTVDSTTFELYLNNMRNMMSDCISLADLVIFNRCSESTPLPTYRRTIKAMNAPATILFEMEDGSLEDGVTDEDLPYDMKADVIRIADDQFGIWYLDAIDHPERYDGKTIRIKGQVFNMEGLPVNCFIFGRHAMTCCADDISGVGFVCAFSGEKPAEGVWLDMTMTCEMGFSLLHRRDGMNLVLKKFKQAAQPEEELVYFN